MQSVVAGSCQNVWLNIIPQVVCLICSANCSLELTSRFQKHLYLGPVIEIFGHLVPSDGFSRLFKNLLN